MAVPVVLIVDDEDLLRWSLAQPLAEQGYRVLQAATGGEAVELAAAGVDLVLLDLRLPDRSGLEVLAGLQQLDPAMPVVMMTAADEVEPAIESIRAGAFHYLQKPFDADELAALCARALETTALRRELAQRRRDRAAFDSVERIIGSSDAIVALRQLVVRVAESPASTVLITGESGTGKEMVARAIHHASRRVDRALVDINCSALPAQLMESELFGHERGAFTDAHDAKRGLIELAEGGTLFLDEIGELGENVQAKLLRFLEDHTFRRIGGDREIAVDVRVVAATNRKLEQEVEAGRFREDLLYRLQVVVIELPALRERLEDVPLLLAHFIASYNKEFSRAVRGVSEECIARLSAYHWPGNVRELRNAVERAVLLADDDLLDSEDFPCASEVELGHVFRLPEGGIVFEELERDLVRQALERAEWSRTGAGALLGLNRDQVRYRIEKFQLGELEGQRSG